MCPFHYITLFSVHQIWEDGNTNVEIISDIESEIDVIGYQFNAFLAQCGYARNNQFMLMKDLTEEEVELLTVYLDEIRNKRKVADK